MEQHADIIRHPSAWQASDFAGTDGLAVELTPRHLAAFEEAVTRLGDGPVEDIGRADFALSGIAEDVAAWRAEVMAGRGLLLLRGFPVGAWREDEIARLYWGLGTHFGEAVSQSTMGDRLGHVVDIAGKDPKERAYRNSTELGLHTDACDAVAMLCLQKAVTGGVSGFTSGPAVYNVIRDERPELLAPLCRGYHYHRFGEQRPGESPVSPHRVPVFSVCQDLMSVCYLRSYIEMAAAELGEPLCGLEREALDVFEAVANRPSLRLDVLLQPGEAVFFNNYTVLHTRTAFDDAPEPALKRHMLRLWLKVPDGRPVVDEIRAYEGRGGIAQQARASTYYQGRLDYHEFGPRKASSGA